MPRPLPPSPNILVFDEVLRDVTPPKPLYRTQYFHNRDPVKRHGYQFQVILLFVSLLFGLTFVSNSVSFPVYYFIFALHRRIILSSIKSFLLFSLILLLSFILQEIRSLQIKSKAVFTLCEFIAFSHKVA